MTVPPSTTRDQRAPLSPDNAGRDGAGASGNRLPGKGMELDGTVPELRVSGFGGVKPLWVRCTSILMLCVYFCSLGSALGQGAFPPAVTLQWGLGVDGFHERSVIWETEGAEVFNPKFAAFDPLNPGYLGTQGRLSSDGSSVLGFGALVSARLGDKYEVVLWSGLTGGFIPQVGVLDFGWQNYTLKGSDFLGGTLVLGGVGLVGFSSGINVHDGANSRLGNGSPWLNLILGADNTWRNVSGNVFTVDTPIQTRGYSVTIAGFSPIVLAGTLIGSASGTLHVGSGSNLIIGNRALDTLGEFGGGIFLEGGILGLAADVDRGSTKSVLTLFSNTTIVPQRFSIGGENHKSQVGMVNAGTSNLSVLSLDGSGMVVSGTYNLGTAQFVNVSSPGGSGSNLTPGLTLGGAVTAGTNQFLKTGDGVLLLTGTSGTDIGGSEAGVFMINRGVLAVNSDLALGTPTTIVDQSGSDPTAGFRATGSFSTFRSFRFGSVANNGMGVTGGNTLTLTSPFIFNFGSGASMQKNDAGTLELAVANGTWSGPITVAGGGLLLSAGTAAGTGLITVQTQGAALQLRGVSLTQPLSLNASGINSAGALEAVSGTSTVSGLITLASGVPSFIAADAGATLLMAGTIQVANPLTLAGAGSVILGPKTVLSGSWPGTVNKLGTGTAFLLFAGTNFFGALNVNGGSLILGGSGIIGGAANAVTIQPGATLVVDNLGANVANRLGGSLRPLNLSGGLLFSGTTSSGTLSAENLGALTLASGNSVITLNPGSGGSFTVSLASLTNKTGATLLLRGGSVGSAQGANTGTFTSGTAAVTLFGGTVNDGVFNKGILPYTLIDPSGNGTGTSFATVDRSGTLTVAAGTFRALKGGEYFTIASSTATLTADRNTLLSANLTQPSTVKLTSLTLSDGSVLSVGSSASSVVLTLSSGGLLLSGDGSGVLGGTLNSGASSLWIFAPQAGSTHTISSALRATTGTPNFGLVKAGQGTLLLNGTQVTGVSSNLLIGAVTVNEGTLQLGVRNAFNYRSPQPLVVNGGGVSGAGGVLDLNGYALTIGSLASQGAAPNAGVAGGRITSSVSSGTFASLVSSSGIGTDSAFAGIISGSQLSFSKVGFSTLTLLSKNTYGGPTLITGGGITLNDYGALSATSAITLKFGTLTLDNRTGLTDLGNRVSDTAPLMLTGAGLNVIGRAQTQTAETLGPLVLGAGLSTITLTPGNTGVNSVDLTVGSFSANSSQAFLNIVAGNLGVMGNFSRLRVSAGAEAAVVSQLKNGILPWVVVNGVEFASYTANSGSLTYGGFGALNSTGFISTDQVVAGTAQIVGGSSPLAGIGSFIFSGT